MHDGDVLLTVDGLEVSGWRTNTNVHPMDTFYDKCAGSKVVLGLKRGEKNFETVAVLRDIVAPRSRIKKESERLQPSGSVKQREKHAE